MFAVVEEAFEVECVRFRPEGLAESIDLSVRKSVMIFAKWKKAVLAIQRIIWIINEIAIWLCFHFFSLDCSARGNGVRSSR